MAKYITVLNSDLGKPYWKAVQVAASLDAIRKNKFYTAGVSSSLDKNEDDVLVESKTIIEVSTQNSANATVYKLAQSSLEAISILNSKASKKLIEKLTSKI